MASDEEDDDTSSGRGEEAPSERVAEFYLRMVGTAAPTAPGLGDFSGVWANAIAFANAPARADATVDGWTALGPRTVGGAVRSLEQDPVNLSTFYAGTAGAGLWRTTDDGVTWTQLGGDKFGASPVGAVAVAPTTPPTLYVGTGEPLAGSISGLGLFKSTDGGAHFTSVAPATSGAGGSPRFTRIRVHPTQPGVVWVAGSSGLWRFDSTGAHREDVLGTGVDKNITDLAIAPGPAGGNTAVLIAGVHSEGVRRGVYNPTGGGPNPTTWSASTLNTTGTDLPQHMGRVRVAIAPSDPSVVYAMVEDWKWDGGDGAPQRLYASSDGGIHFSQKPQGQSDRNASWPTDTSSKQAFYSMVLEVHPTQPKTVIAGHVNLYLSLDGGRSWPHELIKWENNWRFAQRAEHGDMHAIVFDRRDALSPTPRLWIGNDGGVSFTDAWSSQFNWRKRSYGILAGQVVDVTSHPVYPSIIACGMQDNATFISYGGPTWHQIAWADGAAAVMDPTDPRRLFISWQSGFAEARIGSGDPSPDFKQELPEVPATDGSSPTAPRTNFLTSKLDVRGRLIWKDPIFRALLVGDTTVANRFVVGRKEAAYITTNGTSFDKLDTGDFTPSGDPDRKVEVGALALVSGGQDIYVSSSKGDLFVPKTGGATGWDKKTPFTGTGTNKPWICGIAIHPTKPQVVAACAYLSTVSIMLSHDSGQTWFSADGAAGQLPPGPMTCLAFHPTDEKVLFAGSLAGVFVARDLPAYSAATPATSANPTWKTLLKGAMKDKPMLVNDLEIVAETLTLRAGTFSSGVYEMNIADSSGTTSTPAGYRVTAVRLSIRDHALDDSRTYPPAHTLPGDPRLPSAHDTSHLDGSHSIDIKVDSSDLDDRTRYLLSERFRHQPDAAELDEEFVSQNPIAGDVNVAYVQVHNRGYDKATGVKVRLYVGDAGPLGVAPALDGINWASNPTAASGWTLLEEKTGLDVEAGNPKVVRFEWTCPMALKSYAALLAICHSAADPLAPAEVPSTGSSLDYAKGERRAALRVLPVIQDRIFIRDGLDDRGRRGSVAWGGTSPDIMVMTKAAADALFDVNNPTTGPFKNLNDARRSDRVRAGDTAIFVRVSNRGSVPLNAEVKLYRAAMGHITDAAWTQVGAAPVAVNAIPARGWRVARFDLAAADGGDPAPGKPAWAKSYFFAAVVRVLDPSDGTEVEPFPNPNSITDVDGFWRFFGRGSSGNNAAFRTVRFEEGP